MFVVFSAGKCWECSNVSAADGDSNSNRARKQKSKQLKRMESVESASYSIMHQLLEEVGQLFFFVAYNELYVFLLFAMLCRLMLFALCALS